MPVRKPSVPWATTRPLAVLSDSYRGHASIIFRQNFSQVTNPPIDSLRERRVMSLRTRLGNLGNILDEAPEPSATCCVLESSPC